RIEPGEALRAEIAPEIGGRRTCPERGHDRGKGDDPKSSAGWTEVGHCGAFAQLIEMANVAFKLALRRILLLAEDLGSQTRHGLTLLLRRRGVCHAGMERRLPRPLQGRH